VGLETRNAPLQLTRCLAFARAARFPAWLTDELKR
jgi:hypothetical protein